MSAHRFNCIHRMASLARRFRAAEHGNITIVAVASMFVMAVAAGSAIDYGRVVTAKTQLAAAVDSAALQAGISTVTDIAKLKTLAQSSIQKNFTQAEHGDIVAFNLVQTDSLIQINATARFKTSFMGIVGIPTIDIPDSSEVTRSGNNLEVALILDTTGSMNGNKLKSLKAAATDFIDKVVWDNQTKFFSKVALIPYSSGVNLGSRAVQARGPITAGTCSSPGCASYKFKNTNKQNRTLDISTCASERTGAEALTDASPSTARVGMNYASPNNPCLDSEMIPLTTDKATLKNAIAALDAKGSTAGQIGIAWGWYALSKNFGMWSGASIPTAYDTKEVSKIAVIMTDGEFNTSYCNGVIARNSGNGSGLADDKINCDATNGDAVDQAKQLCAAMKKKKIIIYTVGFDISNDAAAKDVMTTCASSSGNAYLAATDAELKAAFAAIGRKVSALRISK